jgi:hypothetical protein
MQKNKRVFIPGKYIFHVGRSRAGLGLFTKEPIAKGACVIEYTGKVLSVEEEKKSNSLYLFDAGDGKTIDGAARSNTARYINHSCRPNCEIELQRKRVWVIAKRNIKAGEELSYDYDPEYFNAYIKSKGCRCLKCKPEISPTKNR